MGEPCMGRKCFIWAFCIPLLAAIFAICGPMDRSSRAASVEAAVGDATSLASLFKASPKEVITDMTGQYTSFESGVFQLSDHDRISTKEQFAPPIAFRMVVKTTSTNIRVGYAADQIIFNWEGNPDQLRVDGGPAHGRNMDGVGKIPVNEWVTIDLAILNNSMWISVNGEPRYYTHADFSGVNQPLSFFQGAGATIYIKSLLVGPPSTKYYAIEAPQNGSDNTAIPDNVSSKLQKGEGPAKDLVKTQGSIKALYVMEQDSGGMLGMASDLILTATPGEAKGDTIPVDFGTPVGPEMQLVLDDVLRVINHKYPLINVSRFEFTFEDKYTGHDGGSIGAALGTLMLSLIEGFDIDPQLAITGDVSAEGKIHAIGGVTAKLRGAKAAGCTLVAIPTENFEQLADTLIYSGTSAISDLQVIGVSSLEDASVIARVDRDAKLKRAIDLFGEVQQEIRNSPDYLQGSDAQTKLQHVLELAPQHFSAKLLLQVAQNKQRRRLTAGASEYYAFVALNSVLPALDEEKLVGQNHVMPAAMSQGLVALQKLRPISDLRIQPLIDACGELIQARSDFDMGSVTADLLKDKYRAFLEEMSKLQADTALMEKMLGEGV
jgi:hypothetical protein